MRHLGGHSAIALSEKSNRSLTDIDLSESEFPGEEPDGVTVSPDSFQYDTVTRTVEVGESGWRLDLYLVYHFPKFSRMIIRKAIQTGGVLVDGRGGKTAYRLKPGQRVTMTTPEIPREAPQAENIPLDILHEDADLIVVNKPAGMVVHPSRGHWSGTLVSALAWHFDGQLSSVRGPCRPGIVHRLDRDTSGAILVAKNDMIHSKLAALFQERRIRKEYFAIAWGSPNLDRDMIDLPIGHHPKYREKMAILKNDPDTKEAQTFYEVVQRFRGITTIRVLPKTGRTHQIRLHLAHIGCPILCDMLYGRQSQITLAEIEGKTPNGDPLLSRQALHAHRLTFEHPNSGQTLDIVAPIPDDLRQTLEVIEKCRYNR
ncbi:MAG: RluA family pseudouridine synthase [Planctomycetaceae bacterium]|nr:RluA family pseudouridine synthase [Planctomycetaceae bacterium]